MALPAVIAALGRVAKTGYDAYKMSKKVKKVKKLMKKGDASAYSAKNRDARHKLLSKKKYQNKKTPTKKYNTKKEAKKLGVNPIKNSSRPKLKYPDPKQQAKQQEELRKSLVRVDPKTKKIIGKVSDSKFKKQMQDFKEWSKTAITNAKKDKK